MLALLPEVDEMAAVSIRNLDETVRERLRIRAAAHGRSMEAEMRAILIAAVEEPGDNENVVESLVYEFAALGGVNLQLPPRDESARTAELEL